MIPFWYLDHTQHLSGTKTFLVPIWNHNQAWQPSGTNTLLHIRIYAPYLVPDVGVVAEHGCVVRRSVERLDHTEGLKFDMISSGDRID